VEKNRPIKKLSNFSLRFTYCKITQYIYWVLIEEKCLLNHERVDFFLCLFTGSERFVRRKMVYCDGCGEILAYEVKFCGKCGTAAAHAPRAIPGKGGLDPKRFAGGEPPASTVVQTTGGSSGGSNPTREPGSVVPSLAGTY
jgi:hypothetical protein